MDSLIYHGLINLSWMLFQGFFTDPPHFIIRKGRKERETWCQLKAFWLVRFDQFWALIGQYMTLNTVLRRAILHLKTQKKKIKDKNKSKEDTPPFFDTSCLKSKTIQILMISSGFSALGAQTPLYYLVRKTTCVLIIMTH